MTTHNTISLGTKQLNGNGYLVSSFLFEKKMIGEIEMCFPQLVVLVALRSGIRTTTGHFCKSLISFVTVDILRASHERIEPSRVLTKTLSFYSVHFGYCKVVSERSQPMIVCSCKNLSKIIQGTPFRFPRNEKQSVQPQRVLNLSRR